MANYYFGLIGLSLGKLLIRSWHTRYVIIFYQIKHVFNHFETVRRSLVRFTTIFGRGDFDSAYKTLRYITYDTNVECVNVIHTIYRDQWVNRQYLLRSHVNHRALRVSGRFAI